MSRPGKHSAFSAGIFHVLIVIARRHIRTDAPAEFREILCLQNHTAGADQPRQENTFAAEKHIQKQSPDKHRAANSDKSAFILLSKVCHSSSGYILLQLYYTVKCSLCQSRCGVICG